ncbi:hypothetical protein KKF81_03700 [Candidatus Micrarchaeota archaeon]|nr:hypothetical protein [Candidatus Micrarchaeota archaeon]MBU1166029.1 hypothetical protein [Candidatus Micrarchaeota archaeon]MBU1886356.1 hypothetical protein [Candidatus Micrarchaeota archaeon]
MKKDTEKKHADDNKFRFEETYLVISDRSTILKLRSLGAGVEEADETKIALLEAAYFADRGVIPIEKDKIFDTVKKHDKLYMEKFYVIKYLRDRGYIVRPSLDNTDYLRLHRKGVRPGEDRTYGLIMVVPKNWKCDVEDLLPSLETAGRLRKELVIAIVDIEQEKPLFLKFGRMTIE